MANYVGLPSGQVVSFQGPSALSHAGGRPYSFTTSLKGRRRAQLGPGRRRMRRWDVRLPRDSAPLDFSALAALADGEYGNGPFYWLDPWAQRTNAASPEGSDVARVLPAAAYTIEGPVALSDGTLAGAHVASTSSTSLPTSLLLPRLGADRLAVPVRPGDQVTVSLWVYSGTTTLPRIRIAWATGPSSTSQGTLSPTSSPAYVPGTWWRASATGIAPPNAIGVLVSPYTSCLRATRPAITFSDELLPWMPGQAAAQAVFPDLETVVHAARPGDGGQRAALNFSVEEVGP